MTTPGRYYRVKLLLMFAAREKLAAASSNRLPAALMLPMLADVLMLPAVVRKTSAPALTRSFSDASLVAEVVPALETRLTDMLAVLVTDKALASVMNIPPVPATPLRLDTSVVRWLAPAPTAPEALVRSLSALA